MIRIRSLAVLLAFTAGAAEALDAARLMSELAWGKRVLLVFAADELQPEFQRQLALATALRYTG